MDVSASPTPHGVGGLKYCKWFPMVLPKGVPPLTGWVD